MGRSKAAGPKNPPAIGTDRRISCSTGPSGPVVPRGRMWQVRDDPPRIRKDDQRPGARRRPCALELGRANRSRRPPRGIVHDNRIGADAGDDDVVVEIAPVRQQHDDRLTVVHARAERLERAVDVCGPPSARPDCGGQHVGRRCRRRVDRRAVRTPERRRARRPSSGTPWPPPRRRTRRRSAAGTARRSRVMRRATARRRA